MKNNKRKIVIGLVILVVLIAILGILYNQFKPKPTDGVKHITIEVVDDKNATTSYTLTTEAEVLRDAMDELKDQGLTYGGVEEEVYGMMIDVINGVYADYRSNGAYWSIYVNGEYGKYVIEMQPVVDGDTYTFKYEVNAQ